MAVVRCFPIAVFSTTIVIGLAMGGPGPASGADMTVSYKAPASAAAAFNWSGCYLGGYVGGATESRQVNAWDPSSTGGVLPAGTYYDPIGNKLAPNPYNIGEFNYDLKPSVIGGTTIGCNWQGASSFVFGVEGEGGYMKVSGSNVSRYSIDAGSDTVDSTRIGDWDAAVAGRFGYAWDRVLVYLKGGVGFSSIKSSVIDTCTAGPCNLGPLTATGSSNQPFWVAGIGIEYAFNHDWSIKGEFLNLGMFKKFDVCGTGAAAAAGSTFCGIHNIEGVRTYKVGVNYHFNTPIVARY
jgi:outer membrane immunogenic protein